MKVFRIIIACAAACVAPLFAAAGPARFWISASNSISNPDRMVPKALRIEAPVGIERKLYIWGQPATNVDGTFKTLLNVSLNLVLPDQLLDDHEPVVDFEEIKVYHELNGPDRFQFVHDSFGPQPPYNPDILASNTDQVGPGLPDGIGGRIDDQPISGRDIQGFSFPDLGYLGIGPDPETDGCFASDVYCAMTTNGPAWLVAEISFKTLQPTGTNPYFLQIGYGGLMHLGEQSPTESQVVFGVNEESQYQVGLYDPEDEDYLHRQHTFPSDYDTPHVWISAVPTPPAMPGDYDRSGTVGPEDHLVWRSSFGQSVAPGEGADGNGDGDIDAADFVIRQKYQVTPGDYDRNGLVNQEDYHAWQYSFGQSTSPGTGADGNGDGFINVADYVFWRKIVIAPAGDYDDSGTTGPEDYDYWQASFGQSISPGQGADGNGDGVVSAADYVVWRKSLGAGSAIAAKGGAGVPEPSELVLIVPTLLYFFLRRRLL